MHLIADLIQMHLLADEVFPIALLLRFVDGDAVRGGLGRRSCTPMGPCWPPRVSDEPLQ